MNKENLPLFLAISVTVGLISIIILLAFHDTPTTSHDIVMTMVGVLGTAFASIISYYFGSSAGSSKKTDIMAKNGNEEVKK